MVLIKKWDIKQWLCMMNFRPLAGIMVLIAVP